MGVKPRVITPKQTLMYQLTRSLSLALAAAAGLAVSAQHTLYVMGHANPCMPTMNGSTVTIVVHGSSGVSTMATTTMNQNCYYYMEMSVPDTEGHVVVSGSCGNGTVGADSTNYSLPPGSNTDVLVNLNCSGTPPPPCEACFTVEQTAPWTGVFTSCSSGGVGPYTYLWDFSQGGAMSGNPVTHSFNGAGSYAACLNLMDANGCQISTCQQVYVDEQGNFSNEPPTDCAACMEITQATNNGVPQPWAIQLTSCATGWGNLLSEWQLPNGSWASGNTFTFTATQGAGQYLFCQYLSSPNGCTAVLCDSVQLDANGLLVTDPVEPCEAGFWVIQAYENGDTLGGEPIPNTLWIWNLSNGGTGLFQFQWNFGDGTTSTEPFPTHVYAGTGPYELCLTIWDSGTCTDTYCDTVSVDENGLYNGMIVGGGNAKSVLTINVIEELGTSVAEVPELDALELWPNPVEHTLEIALGSNRSGTVPMMVIDAAGRTVLTVQQPLVNGMNRIQLDTTPLEAGMYLLRLGDRDAVTVRRFVKAN